MGKNGRHGKMYGKVVGKDAQDRPGYFKKAVKAPKAAAESKEPEQDTEATIEPAIPIELQQLLLNIFKDSFPELLTSEDLQPLLQEIKAALYERDFSRAFGSQQYLEAYSVRWSPSRSLCYLVILVDISEHLSAILPSSRFRPKDSNKSGFPQVVSFGGCSAEVVAFAGFIKNLQRLELENANGIDTKLSALRITGEETDEVNSSGLDLLLLDSARWESAVQKLHQAIIAPPTISKYASAAVRGANPPLLNSEDITASFILQDILEMSQEQLVSYTGNIPVLLTCLFTLNELYTASISKTTAFLLKLTMAVLPGTLFLVVDSPGSYSETTVGSESKKYPMAWLLDHCLLTQAPKSKDSTSPDWIKIVSDDSRWFRIPEALRYPIPLESMRYQIHLYQRV